MLQMKEGGLKGLPPAKRKELSEQVEKMKKIVDAPKIGGIVRKNGRPEIQIASGSRFLEGEDFQVQDFASYFNQRVITTLDGNTDACTVDMLQDGDLPTLTATVIKGGLTMRRS